MGDQGEQTETYKKMEDKKSESWDATNAWLGFTDKYWAAALLPDTDAKVRARFSAGETGGVENLSDRLSAAAADHRAGRDRHRRCAAVRRRQGSLRRRHQFPRRHRRRLQRGASPQPFRSVDRLGLVLLHHQADVPRHRLFLPSRRQFRHRHPDRHRAGQDSVLPARQQILRLDGEDEGGAAADGDDQGALSATTR